MNAEAGDLEGDVWAGDLLARRGEAEHLQEFVLREFERRLSEGRTASYILNVDARWGEGKTFFLERLARQLRANGHLLASINAWQEDLSGEPLTSIMAAMAEVLKPCVSRSERAKSLFRTATGKLGIVAYEGSKQLASHAIKVATGISVQRLAEELGAKDADDKVAERSGNAGGDVSSKLAEKLFERSIKAHKDSLAALVAFKSKLRQTLEAIAAERSDIKPPFFVLIDELDRCRPLYAIKLLEDAKHIFDVSGVVFIIATDSEQLAHSIKAVYGEGFEARRYLRRFFDRVYVFPHNDRFQFAKSLFRSYGLEEDRFQALPGLEPHALVASWIRAFGVSARDAERCFDIIATFAGSWDHPAKINLFFLLVYVWSFYTRNDREMTLFTDMDHARVEKTSLGGWRLQLQLPASLPGESNPGARSSSEEVVSAEDLVTRLFRAIEAACDLSFADPVWGPGLMEEYHLEGTWRPLRQDGRSVLSEYPSRVWNSGRVIDRVPPP